MRPLKVGLTDVLRRSDIMFLLDVNPVPMHKYKVVERELVVPLCYYRGQIRDNLGAAIGVHRHPDGNIFEPAFTPPDRYRRIPRQEKLRFSW